MGTSGETEVARVLVWRSSPEWKGLGAKVHRCGERNAWDVPPVLPQTALLHHHSLCVISLETHSSVSPVQVSDHVSTRGPGPGQGKEEEAKVQAAWLAPENVCLPCPHILMLPDYL